MIEAEPQRAAPEDEVIRHQREHNHEWQIHDEKINSNTSGHVRHTSHEHNTLNSTPSTHTWTPHFTNTHTFILLDMLQEQTAQIPLETANERPEGQNGCSFITFGSSGVCGFALNTMTRGSFSSAFSSNRNQDFNYNQNWETESIITSVALSRCDAAGHDAKICFLLIHLVLATVMWVSRSKVLLWCLWQCELVFLVRNMWNYKKCESS